VGKYLWCIDISWIYFFSVFSIRRPELLEMLLLAKARILTLDTTPESYSTDSSPEEENNEKEF